MQTFLSSSTHPGSIASREPPAPAAEKNLIVHQPDPETPDRLLGTCDECKSWYLMDARTKRDGAAAVRAAARGSPVPVTLPAGVHSDFSKCSCRVCDSN